MTHCPKKIHEGDTGVLMRLKIVDQDGTAVDLSTASLLEITIQQPSASLPARTATSTVDPDDASESLMHIASLASDFPVAGWYSYQGHVVLSGGEDLKTEVIKFEVHPNL